jgi:hypothetical protein
MKYTAELGRPPRIKVGSVEQIGGKIRGISLHEPQVSHAARCLGNRMIASVKRKSTVKEPLFNKEFQLFGLPDSFLVSADLSKATDYFQHELSKAVILGCAQGQGWSDVETEAALTIFGPQELEDGRVTQTGAHMGLAGTWAILNAVNAYCAYRATGNNPRTHKQCGDDLIGLFTHEQKEAYARNLEDLRLVYNREKSFEGMNGRFCENFVTITHSDDKEVRATCTPDIKIAEATGAQELNGFSNDPVRMVSGLSQLQRHANPIVRSAAESTLRRLENQYRLVPNLPLQLGGSGRITRKAGKREINALLRYICTGRGVTSSQTNSRLGAACAKVRKGQTNGFVTTDEARIHVQIMEYTRANLDEGLTLKADAMPRMAVRRQAAAIRKELSKEETVISPKFLRRLSYRTGNINTLRNRLQQGSAKSLRKLANSAIRLVRPSYLSKRQVAWLVANDWQYCKTQIGETKHLLGISPTRSDDLK